MRYARWFRFVAVTAVWIGVGAASAAEPTTELPPGPGHDLTAQVCLKCHQADVIVRRRLNREDWQEMVGVMVSRGAQADEQQQAEIVEYLSRTLAPAAKPEEAVSPPRK